MNWQVVGQVLDLLAFILVTPEVIGEKRLETVRGYLGGRALVLKAVLISIICLLVAVAVFVAVILASVEDSLGPKPSKILFFGALFWVPGAGAALLLSSVYLNSHIIPWLIRMTASVAVRGRLFLAGGGLFLIARILGMWLATHTGHR